jgi:uncharacterized protein
MQKRIVHFDIKAENPERAIAFYEKAFGWSFKKWDGPMEYWLITTGPENLPGINGGLSKRTENVVCEGDHGFSCTVGVDKLDDTIKAIQAAGGTIVMPKTQLPDVGWFATFKDTEGNAVGLMEPDPNMKPM